MIAKYLLVSISLFQIQHIWGLTWNGNFEKFPTGWKISKISNPELHSIVNDPKNSAVKVLKIKHPKGSCSSACGIPGGAGFDVFPFDNFNGNVASLEYSVFFHSTFNYVKGGKLPGIFGGAKGCSGCNSDVTSRTNCFSARFMWGANGLGYPYLYLPLNVKHEADFCSKVKGGKCAGDCGWNFSESPYFTNNQWTKIREKVTMNTPGKNDGRLEVWVNGVKKIDYQKMNYRTKTSVGIKGFTIHPFFGGSGDQWKTPVDTYTLYKDFKFTDY